MKYYRYVKVFMAFLKKLEETARDGVVTDEEIIGLYRYAKTELGYGHIVLKRLDGSEEEL